MCEKCSFCTRNLGTVVLLTSQGKPICRACLDMLEKKAKERGSK